MYSSFGADDLMVRSTTSDLLIDSRLEAGVVLAFFAIDADFNHVHLCSI
jgi:hypothetical protein